MMSVRRSRIIIGTGPASVIGTCSSLCACSPSNFSLVCSFVPDEEEETNHENQTCQKQATIKTDQDQLWRLSIKARMTTMQTRLRAISSYQSLVDQKVPPETSSREEGPRQRQSNPFFISSKLHFLSDLST